MHPNEVLDQFEQSKAEYADRNVAIMTNRDFVLGNQMSEAEVAALGEGRKPLIVNYIYPIVQKNVTFFVGRTPEISVPLAEDSPESRAYAQFQEKALYGLHHANRMARRYFDMAWNCSVAGGQPIITDYDPVRRIAAWKTPLPERCYPMMATDDDLFSCEGFVLEEHYSERYLREHYGILAEADYSDGRREFVTVVRCSDAHQHVWVTLDGQLVAERAGYGFVPYDYAPNIPVASGVDGLADVTLLRPLQRQLNELLTAQADVVELYSDPPVIMEGTGLSDAQIQSIDWGPGLKLPVQSGGKVYMLHVEGTPPDFQQQLTTIITAMQDLSNMPDVTFGRYTASIQSGIALNTQFQPTRLLMAIKQASWTDAMEQVHAKSFRLMRERLGENSVHLFGSLGDSAEPYTLEVRGIDLEGAVRSTFVWPGMLPKDDATEAQTLLNRLAGRGISLRTYLEQMGHESPEEEIRRIKEESKDPDLHPELQPAPAAGAPAGGGGGGMEESILASMMGGGDASMPFGGDMGSAAMPSGMGMDGSNVSPEESYARRGLV